MREKDSGTRDAIAEWVLALHMTGVGLIPGTSNARERKRERINSENKVKQIKAGTEFSHYCKYKETTAQKVRSTTMIWN